MNCLQGELSARLGLLVDEKVGQGGQEELIVSNVDRRRTKVYGIVVVMMGGQGRLINRESFSFSKNRPPLYSHFHKSSQIPFQLTVWYHTIHIHIMVHRCMERVEDALIALGSGKI